MFAVLLTSKLQKLGKDLVADNATLSKDTVDIVQIHRMHCRFSVFL